MRPAFSSFLTINTMIQHVCWSGRTRYGKSEACLSFNAPRMRRKDRPAFVIVDPHGGLAKKFAMHAIHYGLQRFLIYHVLRETSQTPGYAFFTPSDHPDPEQRQAENRERVNDAISILVRGEGKIDAAKAPILREGLELAFNVLINQRTPLPFTVLNGCFSNVTDNHQRLLAGLTDGGLALRFVQAAALAGSQWEYKNGPADRRIRAICECIQFAKSCVATFDFAAHMNAGGILIVDGESKGNLGRADAAVLFGMIVNLLISLCRSGKITRRVVLVVDEGLNAGIADLNLARALNEAAKWGLEIQVIIHNPFSVPDPEVKNSIFSNCDRMMFFRQTDPKATHEAAVIAATPRLDPFLVHHTEKHFRQLDDGVEEIATQNFSEQKDHLGKSKGKTYGHNVSIRTKRREVMDLQDKYFDLPAQITLMEQKIATLGVGYCIKIDGTYVSAEPEYQPMLRLPWSNSTGAPLIYSKDPFMTLAEKKLFDAFEVMKQRPEYQTPVINLPPLRIHSPSTGKAKRKGMTG